MPHQFTPTEANRTLPLVRRIVADILQRGRELRSLAPRRAEPRIAARIRRAEDALRELMRELERIGCTYKDFAFEIGLVDFPSRIEGRDVLLCWRSDEDSVGHFHTAGEGYAGRRPIPAELLEPR